MPGVGCGELCCLDTIVHRCENTSHALLHQQYRPETPAERAHLVFTSLGLRHLVVVSENSHVRGLITRRDLDAAAGHGAWRRNKMAPAPVQPPPSGAQAFLLKSTGRSFGLITSWFITEAHQCRL